MGLGLPVPTLENMGNGFLLDVAEFRTDFDRFDIAGFVQVGLCLLADPDRNAALFLIEDATNAHVITDLLHEPLRVDPIVRDLTALADNLDQAVEIVLACQ